MKAFQILGKILFSIPMLAFGIKHLVFGPKMSLMVPAFVPFQIFWVYITGIVLILAGLSIIFEKFTKELCTTLGFTLLAFVLLIHLPDMANPQLLQTAMNNLLKDTALAGAAFYFAAVPAKKF